MLDEVGFLKAGVARFWRRTAEKGPSHLQVRGPSHDGRSEGQAQKPEQSWPAVSLPSTREHTVVKIAPSDDSMGNVSPMPGLGHTRTLHCVQRTKVDSGVLRRSWILFSVTNGPKLTNG